MMTVHSPTASATGESSEGSRVEKAYHIADLNSTPAGRKLKQAAGEFEAMLISSLWKSMKSTFADDSGENTDPAHDSVEDWSMQTMSSAIGKAGGFGLGDLILKHLSAEVRMPRKTAQVPVAELPTIAIDGYP